VTTFLTLPASMISCSNPLDVDLKGKADGIHNVESSCVKHHCTSFNWNSIAQKGVLCNDEVTDITNVIHDETSFAIIPSSSITSDSRYDMTTDTEISKCDGFSEIVNVKSIDEALKACERRSCRSVSMSLFQKGEDSDGETQDGTYDALLCNADHPNTVLKRGSLYYIRSGLKSDVKAMELKEIAVVPCNYYKLLLLTFM